VLHAHFQASVGARHLRETKVGDVTSAAKPSDSVLLEQDRQVAIGGNNTGSPVVIFT